MNLNQLTFNELLNDFYIDCAVNQPNQHRLMYNRMVEAMDEMLEEIFDDLVALEDQDLSNNPIYMFPPPNGIQHEFNWQDAIHHLNLLGLHKATEYIEDAIGYPNQNPPIPPNDPTLSFLVGKYNLWINGDVENNINPLFNINSCN